MKIILLKSIAGVGQKYEIKDVSPGYARNYLIPRGMAEVAIGSALKRAEHMKEKMEEEKKVSATKAKEAMGKLEGVVLKITKSANEEGGLFAAIAVEEILAKLKNDHGIDLEKDQLKINTPIKQVGEHEVAIETGELKGVLKIVVEKE